MTQADPDDPGGLIREAYRIEGITKSECRSIFPDRRADHRDHPPPPRRMAQPPAQLTPTVTDPLRDARVPINCILGRTIAPLSVTICLNHAPFSAHIGHITDQSNSGLGPGARIE